MLARYLRLLAVAILAVPAPGASGQIPAGGFTPEQARARMTLPEGFSPRIFAAEPMVRQPVAACFDERGRMWVIEYLQYPNPAGLKPVAVDQYLRTEYDRVPEPPPRGPRGADRIKILEDTDGDGRADRSTTFLDGLNLASGLAVGHGGVFVGQAPYLLFYPDRDRDDRPDGDPEVLLAGFGLQDAHATVNSLIWGPDGWLYGAQGSTVTARIRGVEFQQGIWRYHPRTHDFELFAEGGGNTWGLDFDPEGNAFGSSNGGFVAFPMVQGGYYWKGFAKHGPLHNPHAFGYFDALAYRGPKPGGHVTPGGIIYKGDAYPEAFRGAFIGGNLLSNAVYWHLLSPRGSTFSARLGGTLLDAHDPWFRPVDLLTGPDGSVYVVDWYDRRASHLDPRDTWDRSNGRIYAVDYGERRRVEPFDLARLTSEELVDLRTSPNDWYAAEARRLLAERRDSSIVPRLKQLLRDDRDGAVALRDLGALYVSGGLDDPTALGLLDHPCAVVRRWTVRLLGDEHRMNRDLAGKLIEIAGREPDPTVRSQLASSARRWEASDALPILGRLLGRSEDAADPHIPLLIWWALDHHLASDRDGVVALLGSPEAIGSALARDHLLERVARVLASRGTEEDWRLCVRLLSAWPEGAGTERIVAGMDRGLEGRRPSALPEAITGPLDRLWARSTPSIPLIRLAVRRGDPRALGEAARRAADPHAPEADRRALIEVLGQAAPPEGLSTLETIVREATSPALRLAALDALGRYPQPEVASWLLDVYPALGAAEKDRALDLLCSRKEWAGSLLGAVEAGRVPAKALRLGHVAQIVRLGDRDLVRRLESAWGRVPGPNSPEKGKRIAEVRGMLVEGDKGDAGRGRAVFREVCAGCHRLFDEGQAVGPDLTGAERGDLDFLLTSVVDPSAVIRKEYQAQTVALADGRVLSGLVVEETDATLTLFDGKQQKTTLSRDAIEEQKTSEASVMPEGLLDPLREDQIRDLFKFLQSPAPPR